MFSIFKKRKKITNLSYPHNTNILWNKGIAMLCDHYELNAQLRPESFANIKAGDLVWIRGGSIEQFFSEIFPKIEVPFALVTGDSVRSLPREAKVPDLENIFNGQKLLHWFAQNCDAGNYLQSKITAIPLGIDFHSQYEKDSWRYNETLTPQDQEQRLLQLKKAANFERQCLAYADFQFNNTTRNLIKRDPSIKKDRKAIFKQLKKNPAVFFQKKRLLRESLWEAMSRFEFVISPHGTGLDCHRTWEALVLGSYVIVEPSVLDPLYSGLPVKIVQDYSEISPTNLALWRAEFKQNYHYQQYFMRLTNQHWVDFMRAKLKH